MGIKLIVHKNRVPRIVATVKLGSMPIVEDQTRHNSNLSLNATLCAGLPFKHEVLITTCIAGEEGLFQASDQGMSHMPVGSTEDTKVKKTSKGIPSVSAEGPGVTGSAGMPNAWLISVVIRVDLRVSPLSENVYESPSA